jgi:DMSO/TMAO reductase YedYZ heme-binding membrane subunit
MSMMLSSMSYFFNFLDTKLKYRKQLGLIGYFLALGYSVSLVWRYPDTYLHDFPYWLIKPDTILGLVAMSIFTVMAVVSTHTGMQWAGTRFRPILRTGYVAYFLLVLRAVYLQGEVWGKWWTSFEGLPPPRMLLSLFALGVIGLRLMMQVSLARKVKLAKSQVPAGAGKQLEENKENVARG